MFTFVLAGVAQLVIVDTGLTVMVEAAAVCVAVRVKDVIVEVTVLHESQSSRSSVFELQCLLTCSWILSWFSSPVVLLTRTSSMLMLHSVAWRPSTCSSTTNSSNPVDLSLVRLVL